MKPNEISHLGERLSEDINAVCAMSVLDQLDDGVLAPCEAAVDPIVTGILGALVESSRESFPSD